MRQSSLASESTAVDFDSSSSSPSPSPSPSTEPTIAEQLNGVTGAQNAKKETPAKASSSAAAAASGNQIGKWTFREIINHRWSGNDIDLQIHWDDPDEITWEPEKTIHRDAKSALISYWKKQPGGRPLNPQDPESFTIFAFKGVKGVKVGQKRQRQILVEWVGWAKPTWEPEAVIKQTAPRALKEYLQKRSGKH